MAETASDVFDITLLQRILDEELANGLCTNCGCSDETKIKLVEIDNGAIVIKICANCNYSVGADDSVDYNELRKRFEDRGIASVARMKCENCENCDVEQFSAIEYDDDGGYLMQCLQCKESIIVNFNIFSSDNFNANSDSISNYLKSSTFEDGGGIAETSVENELYYFVDPGDELDSCMRANSASDYNDRRYENDSVTSSGSLRQNENYNEESSDLPVQEEDATKCSELDCYLFCEECQNCDPASFSQITPVENEGLFVECLDCKHLYEIPRHFLNIDSRDKSTDNKMQPINEVRQADDLGRTQVTALKLLQPGDHIQWHRDYIVYHHAIVESVDLVRNQFVIIEYTGGSKKLDGSFARIQRSDINFKDAEVNTMFRINYDEGCTLPTKETLRRARSRLGERDYNPFKNNCQHFATWCKTGRSVSDQVDTLKNRLIRAVGTSGVKAVEELGTAGVIAIAKQIPFRKSCEIARCIGVKHAKNYGAGAAKFCRNTKAGSMVLGIGINLAIEGAFFGYHTYDAYRQYADKKISYDDFKRRTMKLGFESTGGVVGGTVGGVLGQLCCPVLGALVGCTLGNIIGRIIGAFVGKKCSESLYKAQLE